MSGQIGTEFCRPIECAQIGNGKYIKEIEADEAERAALAVRFGLLALDSLSAKLSIRCTMDGLIRVEGRLKADVVQECVVTLKPVRAQLDEPFEQFYTTRPPEIADDLLPFDDEEAPEPVENGVLDLGEAVAQQLALAIEPYPRRSDARFEAMDDAVNEDPPHRPLAGIAKLPLRR